MKCYRNDHITTAVFHLSTWVHGITGKGKEEGGYLSFLEKEELIREQELLKANPKQANWRTIQATLSAF